MTKAKKAQSFGSLAARPPLAASGNRIGLLGGSFNPPHAGHLLIAEMALKRLNLDQVWWMVSPANPIKSTAELSDINARLAATKAIITNKRMIVTTFENQLPTNYTADTIRFLKHRHPNVHFTWLMGADNLMTFHKWQRWQDIFLSLPIAVFDRPGYRLKAMASPAAIRFKKFQIAGSAEKQLPYKKAPAWCYLTHKLSNLSSTELRRKSKG